jgi:enoyl-CoA hydratase/carnithine racemase
MAEGEYKIGLNEVQVGIPVPPAILAGMRRLVGLRSAEQLSVSGALLSPKEALRVGLVDELVAVERVVDHAAEWCLRLLALPAQAMTSTRRLARADLAGIFEVNLEPELQRVIAGWWSPETQATLRALAERLGKKTG